VNKIGILKININIVRTLVDNRFQYQARNRGNIARPLDEFKGFH